MTTQPSIIEILEKLTYCSEGCGCDPDGALKALSEIRKRIEGLKKKPSGLDGYEWNHAIDEVLGLFKEGDKNG